ncbi:MAG TPA: hypothetical protein VF543_22365 [Pyrinomonadaceae bacterium]|jgi:hypothetical protein
MRHLVSEAERLEIASRFESKESVSNISGVMKLSCATIYNQLAKMGIARRRCGFNETELQKICDEYASGKSAEVIANNIGASSSSILGALKRCGISPRTASEQEQYRNRRKHNLNENAFDKPSEERNYFIGLMMADGCVVESKQGLGQRRIQLALNEEDKEIVERFKSFLSSTHTICYQKARLSRHARRPNEFINCRPHVVFSVSSDKLAQALISFGVVPRKSKTASVVGLENDRHFWRGVIDGDGSLGVRKQKGRRTSSPRLTLVGSHDLMQQFIEFAKRNAPGNQVKVCCYDGLYRVDLTGIYAIQICKVVYQGSKVSISRKLETANSIIKLEHEWKPRYRKRITQ